MPVQYQLPYPSGQFRDPWTYVATGKGFLRAKRRGDSQALKLDVAKERLHLLKTIGLEQVPQEEVEQLADAILVEESWKGKKCR